MVVQPPWALALRARQPLRDLSVHLVEWRRDLFGRVPDLGALHHLLEPGERAAVAARDGLAQRDGLADDLQVRAARAAEVLIRRRLDSALWAVHKVSAASPLIRASRLRGSPRREAGHALTV